MSRPVGARIFEACSVLERLGQPATYGQIHEHMCGVIRNNTSKYCQRAVGLQLQGQLHAQQALHRLRAMRTPAEPGRA